MINHLYWFGLSAILIILEMLLGVNFFLLWIGVCAASIGVIVMLYPPLSWELQFIIFALEAVACLVFWHLHLKNNPFVSDEPNLNRRAAQYVGRLVTLNEPIVNGRGRIKIDDSSWRVEGPDLAAGILVKVIAVDGVVLKVEKN